MPRGMDERFEDPSEEPEDDEAADGEEGPLPDDELVADPPSMKEAEQRNVKSTADSEPPRDETKETDDEPLNIREDWDSATIYVEPGQSEEIEVMFTRLKKQLKREGMTLEKNKHFYRGIFELAFDEHREELKEKIRELVKEDTDS